MARITAKLTTGMAVQLSNGRHEWQADEPFDAGGTDSGPNPYELLLGSLAACTCVTISWYCQFKKLPLESVSTNYDFERRRVAQIAERCPVHKTIEHGVEFDDNATFGPRSDS